MNPKIKKLKNEFFLNYPQHLYPEIEQDIMRPYILLVFSVNNLYLCAPFRTNINHSNSFLFRNSVRSITNKSGIDYSKIIILNDLNYLEGNQVVDQDEYNEVAKNFQKIKNEIFKYIDLYVNHYKRIHILHKRQYDRLFRYTTLKYFHNMLNI